MIRKQVTCVKAAMACRFVSDRHDFRVSESKGPAWRHHNAIRACVRGTVPGAWKVAGSMSPRNAGDSMLKPLQDNVDAVPWREPIRLHSAVFESV